jgi:hypothetical protein
MVQFGNGFKPDFPAPGGIPDHQVEDFAFVTADVDTVGTRFQTASDDLMGISIIPLVTGNRNMQQAKESFQ